MEQWIVPLFLIVILLCVIALYRLNSKSTKSIKAIAQFIKNRENIDKVKSEIEQLKNTNKDLEDEIKMGQIFYDNSKEAIVVMDETGKIISVNPAFKNVTGYETNEAKEKHLSFLDSGKMTAKAYQNIFENALKKGRFEQEIWNRKKTGEIYNEKLSLTTVFDKSGNVSNFIAIFKDITDQKELQSKLRLEAKTDSLTKLPNRSLFFDRLTQSLENAKRDRYFGSLLFIDLDHFKSINDTLGHNIGDLLLKEVAKRLVSCVRKVDTVSRLSGDEFTVILSKIKKTEDAALVAENIIKELTKPYHLDGHVLNITCSVGVAIFFHDGDEAEALLNSSDKAMYGAKTSGRNKYKFYSDKLDQNAAEKRDIDKEIKKALYGDGLSFRYRPVVGANNDIKGVDIKLALDEKKYPKLKNVNIFSYSKESSLIVEITDWMIESLSKKDIEILKFNNIQAGLTLSAVHFKQSNVVDKLKASFSKDTARFVKLKINEEIISQNISEAIPKIKELRSYGFEVSLTSFGKGKLSLLDYSLLDFTEIELNEISETNTLYKEIFNIAEQMSENITIDYKLEKLYENTNHKRTLNMKLKRDELFSRLKSIQ
tara:strand:- start:57682 stop:59472 length:1791 start_codon:yes stop_codon:yes gene_type:complete